MSTDANVVVIGAGIIGSSVAYHLAEMGVDDITVVDKGDLDHNDGSTSHAPGGLPRSPDRTSSRLWDVPAATSTTNSRSPCPARSSSTELARSRSPTRQNASTHTVVCATSG